jgi:hypothetical protein
MDTSFLPAVYIWTRHAQGKLRQYGLSENRVKRVIKSPVRVEKGIAEDTIAFMQPSSYKRVNGDRTWSQEIWTMVRHVPYYVDGKKVMKTKVISAWRYPGKTRPGEQLPSEIFAEIEEGMENEE